MSKEATIFLLDVSPQMQINKQFEEAHVDLLKMIHFKIFEARKTDLVSLILMGTQGTANHLSEELGSDYDHLTVYGYEKEDVKQIKMADAGLAHYVKLNTERGSVEADIFGGIVLALQMFSMQFKTAVDKKIFVFTSLSTPLILDGIDEIAQKAIEMEVKIIFIVYPAINEEISLQNLASLDEFLERVKGSKWDSNNARELLDLPKTKSTRPVTTFRGNLVLGDQSDQSCSLVIPIYIFNKTVEFKPPSASMWNANGISDHSVTRNTEYLYRNSGNDVNDVESLPEEVSRNELVKAYYYGRKLVPVYADDEKMWELKTAKCFEIIGFVSAKDVPRHYLSGGIMIVVPSPGNARGLEAFSGLMAALVEKNAYALIRYCRISGASPKLGILSCNPKGQGLFCKIPFKEDLRPYSFPNIPWEIYKGDTQQVKRHKLDTRMKDCHTSRSAINAFIDSMALKNIKEDQMYALL
jgi:ATP-dependent DNA helicase 2 subunit 2